MTPLFCRKKNAISPRLLCYTTVISAFHHCTKKPTKCFKVACPCLISLNSRAKNGVLAPGLYMP